MQKYLKGKPLFLKVGRETIRAPIIGVDNSNRQLPPADVPEARLFALLQRHRRTLVAFLDSAAEQGRLDALLQAVLRTTLRTSTFEYSGWRREGPGRYLATRAELRVDVQTAEIMWRRDELKPIPDSMSQFVDYETLFSKEALHCGLVARQSHRHWVHIVGTEYDLMEWDEYDPLDQGVGAPKIVTAPKPAEVVPPHRLEMAAVLQAIGFEQDICVRALKACNDNADVAAQQLMAGDTFPIEDEQTSDRRGHPGSLGERDDDSDEEQAEPSIFQMLGTRLRPPPGQRGPNGPGGREKPPKVVENATFNGLLHNRAFDPYSEAPNYGMQHKHEFWIGEILGPILLSVYPEEPPERKMTYKLLLPAEPLPEGAMAARLLGMVDPTKDHATWKEVLVWKDRRVVHVFNLVSHGRKMFRSLVYTNDSRFCLHSLPPNTHDRSTISSSVVREAGDFKRKVVNEPSLVVSRRNTDINGHEVFVPARLLQGLIPSALLEAFRYVCRCAWSRSTQRSSKFCPFYSFLSFLLSCFLSFFLGCVCGSLK